MTQINSNKDPSSPATTSYSWDIMAPRWSLLDDVLGGTETMRWAGEARMPRHSQESVDSYKSRLSRATLLNMLELTLESLCGKPFVEPMKIHETMPDELKALFKDMDLQGNNFDSVARAWFRDGLAKGFSLMMVDFPFTATAEGEPTRTLNDDRSEGVRPYFNLICPENVIFASSEIIGGEEQLTHVRIREEHVEQVGFAEVIQSRIRVLEPGLVQVWEDKADHSKPGQKDEWVKIEEYPTSLDFIPLVVFYAAKRQGVLLAKPSLLDLAHMNVAHWQSASDQRNILTVGRFPMLACSGVSEEEGIIKVGPNQVLMTADNQGKFYYVEHTGAAIEAGANDLEALEKQMSSYGAEFLKAQPDRNSATARTLDSAEALSPLAAMVNDFQSALRQALEYMAVYLKVDLPEDATVELDTSFGLDQDTQYDLTALQAARLGRDISRITYLEQLKRLRILPQDFDPQVDEDELQEEQGSGLLNLDAGAAPKAIADAVPQPAPAAGGAKPKGAANAKKPATRTGGTGPKPRGPNQGG